MADKYDFSGWATKNDLLCADGRTIRKNAFQDNDGEIVPLVWNHEHNDPMNVLGHALLQNRENGVYAYCTCNNTAAGQNAKEFVQHGDVCALSIYANKLKQQGGNVVHGKIREVSLVLAGANPGAFIDSVMTHGEESDDEAIIYSGENELDLSHSDDKGSNDKGSNDKGSDDETIQDVYDTLTDKQKDAVAYMIEQVVQGETSSNETVQHSADTTKEDNMGANNNAQGEPTVQEVFDTLTDDQKDVVYYLIDQAVKAESGDAGDAGYEGDGNIMKHNVFDNDYEDNSDVLSHSEMESIISDAKRYGSLKDSVMAHGITDIDYLYPDAQTMNDSPDFIKRPDTWVQGVMNGVHHTPFSRIKSVLANITEDDARAKGYIKGNLKKEEVFSLLKRTTTPTTVYKKQKLDRDDVIDITDFDVVSWLKTEMRFMLDEELARAILVGDGRLASSDEKINEQNIRPIWKDDSLYTIVARSIQVDTDVSDDVKAKAFIKACITSRKKYQGSGNPSLYCSEDTLTRCLLLEDTTGRVIYDSVDKLATALRVKEIVTVPVMEKCVRQDGDWTATLAGIIVNLADYNVGADKGGAVNMFDDFDIDYNAQKYLIETRCSGALIKPYSAIAIEEDVKTPKA